MKIMTQIGIVFGVCLLGKVIAAILPIAFPDSVISMILLFVLLLLKVIKIHHIKEKADFLLRNMAFFFIPAGVGIMDNYTSLKGSILPLLAVCVLTTIITFAATAFTVRAVISVQNRLGTASIQGIDDEEEEVV